MTTFRIAFQIGPIIVSWQIIQTKKLEVKAPNSTEHILSTNEDSASNLM